MQPDRFARKNTSYRWLTCCAVEVHGRLAGYEDVNDSERLSLIRPSGRDVVMKETKWFVGIDVTTHSWTTWLLSKRREPFGVYEATVEYLAGPVWASSEASEQSCPAVSCAGRHEPGDSHEVLDGGDEGGVHLHPFAPAITCAAQTVEGFPAAEGLFDALANLLRIS